MKIKDYWRLAKISLKARKKSTRSTVAGIAFSLIIITPLLFAMVGLNMTISGQLNEAPEQLVATFLSAGKGEIIEEKGYDGWRFSNKINYSLPVSDHNEYFEKADLATLNYTIGTKEMETYSEEGMEIKYKERIVIENDETKYNMKFEKQTDKWGNPGVKMTMMAVVKNDENSLLPKFMSQVKVDNCFEGFKGDGKRQVIVSKNYLDMAGLTPQDVFRKRISVFFEDKYYYRKVEMGTENVQMDAINHFLFQEFEVVGVIDGSKYTDNDIRRADMIFTKASYYDDTGKAMQESQYKLENGGYYIYQGDYKAKDEKAKDYVFPGAIYYNPRCVIEKYNENGNNSYGNIENNVYLYQAKSYDDLNKQVGRIYNAEYSKAFDSKDSFVGFITTPFVSQFQFVYKVFTIASVIGSIFGGVILFAALVNLFNSVKHSVDSRMNYLGVMKAIGAKDSTIPKLYFFEVLRIFLRAYVWILIIGSAICVGIKILLDYLTTQIDLSITIGISWVTIPTVMAVLALVLIVVGFVYSFGCTYVVSKRPITAMLEG